MYLLIKVGKRHSSSTTKDTATTIRDGTNILSHSSSPHSGSIGLRFLSSTLTIAIACGGVSQSEDGSRSQGRKPRPW